MAAAPAADGREVRVGVYDNPPKITMDTQGRPAGILGELLREMASREGWTLVSVRCAWKHCLTLLEEGSIDLLPDVAFTADRAERFGFHQHAALHSWSDLYSPHSRPLESILDLNGGRIAVLANSVQQGFLEQMLGDFGVTAALVPVTSYEEGFRMAQEGRVDAAVANHYFGEQNLGRFGLAPARILFQPSRLFYATPRGRHEDLLAAIDGHLVAWRDEPGSPFAQAMSHWMAPVGASEARIPTWLVWAVVALLGASAAAAGINVLLRRRIREQTARLAEELARQTATQNELARQRGFLQALIRTIPDLVWLKDPDGIFLACNPSFERFLGAREDQIMGRTDYDFLNTDLADAFRDKDRQATTAGGPLVNEAWLDFAADGYRGLFETTRMQMRAEDGTVIGVLGIAHDITARNRAEAELAESRARFQALYAAMTEGVAVHRLVRDADGEPVDYELLDANPAFARHTGIPLERAIGQPASTLFGTLPHLNAFAQVATSQVAAHFEARLFAALDKTFAVSVVSPQADHFATIFADVTERVRHEEEIRRLKDDLEATLNALPDLLFELDAEGRYHAYRSPRTDLLAAPPEALLGRTVAEVLPPETAECCMAALREADEHGYSIGRQIRLDLPVGERWFELSVARKARSTDDLPRFIVISRDISERKRGEIELRRYQEDLEALVEQRTSELYDTQFAMERAGIGIHWVSSDNGRFLYVNAHAAGMLGYSVREMKTLSVPDLDPNFPATAFRDAAGSLFESGSAHFESTMQARDGHLVPVEIVGYLMPEQPDREGRYITFVTDISGRKQAEAELNAAKEAAEAASVAKSAFLANMSHEIRTPLNAIMGMTYLLRRTGVTADQSGRLARIEAAGKHLLEIINAVLDLSKIEAGKFALEDNEIRLGQLVEDAVSLFRERAAEKGLSLAAQIEAPELRLRGDATRIQQALINYIGNAIKFTEAGHVSVRCRHRAADDGQVLIRFEVTDTGIGIPAEARTRLFTPFEQVDNTNTRQHGGTGLGLAVTRRLAQMMGGDAGCDSEPGVGSTFWFTARLARAATTGPAAGTADAGDAERRLASRHAGRRVLLAEDEAVNREVAIGLLADVGLETSLARDGIEATEQAAGHRFALVILDVQMPRMDGMEAAGRIRELPGYADVPIIALTANAFEEDRRRCLEAGMNDFIAKPVVPDTLYAMVLKWLERNPTQAVAPQA
ncbi:MAG: PAS domain-containing protein [Rhodocyclaceae bacterium]|nr:PAS domain-containing protein [Rhodocyclaceae bacterium]